MYWRVLVVALACSVSVVVAGRGEDVSDKDSKALEGEWKVTGVEVFNMKIAAPDLKGARAVIKGDQLSLKLGDDVTKATFKIDPGKKPKAIDVTYLDGPRKGVKSPGIYSLEGDELRICVREGGDVKDRPKEFRTDGGGPLLVWTFERTKVK